MNWLLVLLFVMAGSLVIPPVFAQVEIPVNSTDPCWSDYSQNGIEYWQNCGADDDYMKWALGPWEWVSGGMFSMIIVAVLVVMTYIKYQTVIYPITIGIIMLPTSYFLFPDVFLSYSIIMAFVGVGALIWYIIVRQTKEY